MIPEMFAIDGAQSRAKDEVWMPSANSDFVDYSYEADDWVLKQIRVPVFSECKSA